MVILNPQSKKHISHQKYEEFQKERPRTTNMKQYFPFLQSQSKYLPPSQIESSDEYYK